MNHVLRPYATTGVALVGASVIAVTPMVAQSRDVHALPVRLVDAWSDLVADTTTNLQNIASGEDATAIAEVDSAFLTNPLGVIQALTNVDPTVTSDLTTVPATVNVELPPGLELALAQLSAEAATLNSINQVASQLISDPSGSATTLYEAPAVIANAFLNGQDNISLLDGTINIAGFNGILAPLQDISITLNLTDLLNALGLGDQSLTSLDLSSLLSQLGLGDLTLGGLFTDLGISGDGLGTLLGSPTLSSLLSDLGLSDLGLGSFSLSSVLTDLGLNTTLNNLSLDTVLSTFGIDGTVNLGLGTLLSDLGFSTLVNEGVGTLLQADDPALLTSVLGGLLDSGTLSVLISTLGLNPANVLTSGELVTALNGVTVGDLLGGQSIDTSVSGLLTDLGVTGPTSDLSIGTILSDLGASPSTGDLTLSGLLTDLGVGDTGITSLLNTVNLGDLLGDLGLSNLPLDLSNLGDLSGLTLDGLLGDLGLGDVADITIQPFGGLVTELADVVPQQILAALG